MKDTGAAPFAGVTAFLWSGLCLLTLLHVGLSVAALTTGASVPLGWPYYFLAYGLTVAAGTVVLLLVEGFVRRFPALCFPVLLTLTGGLGVILVVRAADAVPLASLTAIALAWAVIVWLWWSGRSLRTETPLGRLSFTVPGRPRLMALLAVSLPALGDAPLRSLHQLLEPSGPWTLLLAPVLGLLAAGGYLVLETVFPSAVDFFWAHRTATTLIVLAGLAAGGVVWGQYAIRSTPFRFDGRRVEASLPSTSRDSLPNVFLISIDTLRWDSVADRGTGPKSLPHLTSLRRDSIEFTSHFAPSSWTLPSHASLFTGHKPREHGAVKKGQPVYTNLSTFPMHLRQVGYRTVAFTDGGLVRGSLGFSRGFDHYGEFPFQPAQPYDDFLPGSVEAVRLLYRAGAGRHLIPPRKPSRPFQRTHFKRTLAEAREWIRREADARRPFFMFLHTYQVHDWFRRYPKSVRRLLQERPRLARYVLPSKRLPDTVPRLSEADHRLLEKVLEDVRPPIDTKRLPLQRVVFDPDTYDTIPERPLRVLAELRDLSSPETRRLRDLIRNQFRGQRHLYRYGIESLDRILGNFLTFLKRRGLYEDAIILFYSDHGEGFSLVPLVLQHGRRGHVDKRAQLHESLIHTPLWIKLPGGRHAGSRRGATLASRDVFPMLFSHLGIRLGGRPLVPPVSLTGADSAGRSYVTGSGETGGYGQHPVVYVRGRRYKITAEVLSGKVSTRQYWKVAQDPARERRVEAGEVPPDVRRGLDRRLDRLLDRFRQLPDPFRRAPRRLPYRVRRELRALGYL